jgi:hypothetical protein
MKSFHMAVAVALATWIAVPVQAQMSSMARMGGGGYATNMVSPTTADTQIGRGMLMIHRGMRGMQGTGMMTPGFGPGGNAQGLQIGLLLVGVVNQGGLVTSTDNHLHVLGTLTAADGSSQPIDVDQPFAINNGVAAVYVPLSLSNVTLPAVLQVDHVELDDTNGTFGLPGLRIAGPVLAPTPYMTPGMGGTMTPGMGRTMTRVIGGTMTPGMGRMMTPRMGMGGH